jgi:hypothetical protein
MGLAPFARRNTANNVGSVLYHLLGVERTFFTCKALNYNF